ncbi:MAG: LuxR family transcriptional regulator [Mycobacterium sp.]|uniref:helix-turn-helix transcriptional regulator n=1 Tax=Mycobacterium sp. TaxID=1785 RepID=UPI001EB4F9A9|nr:LuxR family transcriptional regulator [Mycobacterium sp.]MBV8785547.1 LuxR family transcriptional regulator [Mycobacterium sp.]
MQTWPLTGREEELEVVAEVLGADGPHAGVVIAGSAGVGKTRLAREAMAAASRRGMVVRWLAGTLAAQSVPLGACVQWAERLGGNPVQLVGRAIKAITASPDDTRVLVVVDDAHLLDNLSAFVLHQLVQRRAATVLLTIRTGAQPPDAVTALWKDGHLRRLDLQPLSRAESDGLLQSALGGPVSIPCADRMWCMTRGNVLFLHHLVAQELHAGRLVPRDDHWRWVGTMEVSQTLVDLVDLRVGAAPEAVLEVIDLVAVAEPLELAYLTALADPTAIEDAERCDLITISRKTRGGVVRLGHPLYGEVRLARAGQLRLKRLRGRIARSMTASNGAVAAPDPVRLAVLWMQSNLAPDHHVYTRAAQTAFQRLDADLTQRLAEAAVGAGADVDTELLRANALTMLSRGAEAEDLLKPLSARPLPEPAKSTAVSLRAVNLLWPLRRPEQARQVVDDALSTASSPASDRMLAFRAVQFAVEAQPAEALRVYESIDRTELTALPALILAWAQCIALGDLGRPLVAGAIAEEAAQLAAASPEATYYQAVILVVFYMQALIVGGCITEALTVANRTYQQCADVPGRALTFAAAISGRAALASGDLRTAVERLGQAVTELAEATDGGSHNFGIDYAVALALTGDVDAAAVALAQMTRRRHPAHAYRESDSLLAEAWVAAVRGHISSAQALAGEAARFARIHGQHGREVVCLQAAIQFGDQHTAARLAELAELVDGRRAGLVARWAAALAARDGGEALLAVSHDLETMGDRVAAADAAAHAALAFRRQNRRGPALTACGRADQLIAVTGARTPATQAAATPLPLSSREREIAILISQGLSNSEIAQALTLSIRTIEGHIYRACARVDAATRSELAELIGPFVKSPRVS